MLQISQAELTQPRQAASLGTLFVLGAGLVLYQLTSLVLAPSAGDLRVSGNIPLVDVEEFSQPMEQGAEFAQAKFWARHRQLERASVQSSEARGKRRATEFSLAPVQTLVRAVELLAVPAVKPPVNHKDAATTSSQLKPGTHKHHKPGKHRHPVTPATVASHNRPSPKSTPATSPVGGAKPATLAPLTSEPLKESSLKLRSRTSRSV